LIFIRLSCKISLLVVAVFAFAHPNVVAAFAFARSNIVAAFAFTQQNGVAAFSRHHNDLVLPLPNSHFTLMTFTIGQFRN
jgi:hypothetical protein